MNQSLNYQNANSSGKMARIIGVPGRNANALGNITSGLASRIETGGEKNDGFQFPDSTKGLVTTCEPNSSGKVARFEQFTNILVEVPYPKINDPCKSFDDKTFDKLAVEQCYAAHAYMNQFTWQDCYDATLDLVTGKLVCIEYRPKWVCSGRWVHETGKFVKNSEECRGAACRCEGPGCKFGVASPACQKVDVPQKCRIEKKIVDGVLVEVEVCEPDPTKPKRCLLFSAQSVDPPKYKSYFRNYKAYSQRQKVEEVSSDKLAQSGSVLPGGNACAAEKTKLAQALAKLNAEQQILKQLQDEYKPIFDAYDELMRQYQFAQSMISLANYFLEHAPEISASTGVPLEQVIAQAEAIKKIFTDASAKLLPEILKLIVPVRNARELINTQQAKVTAAEDELYAIQEQVADCVEKNSLEIPVACYSWYAEYDPKFTLTTELSKRCVMNFPFTKAELRESQKGKGLQAASVPDLPKQTRNQSFDDKEDLWYPNLSDSLSLLSEGAFESDYDNDLTQALLRPDIADVFSSYQRQTAGGFALTNQLRAFDDTVATSGTAELNRKDSRSFTEWWQRFQTDADAFFSPPRIIMRLPDTWILAGGLPVEEGTGPVRDPRSQSIDVQLQAKEDLLGEVASYLEKVLLVDIQEEPLPVVVPMGTSLEYRTAAERWRRWQEERLLAGLQRVPEVDDLIERLNEYAVQIEKVRTLRSQLSRTMGNVLGHQEQILVGISEWVTKNLDAYKKYLQERERRLSLRPSYQLIAKEYLEFADDVNAPWCRNDRFTTPIYSLLDPWFARQPVPNTTLGLQGNPLNCSDSSSGLPLLCAPYDESDLMFDLSHLRVMTGSVTIPVLKPTQIRLAIPLPGPATEQLTQDQIKTLDLPALPVVPTIGNVTVEQLPKVTVVSTGSILPPPKTVNTQLALRSLLRAYRVIDTMKTAYKEFWDSLEPTEQTKKLECDDYGISPCTHTEMDLIERLTRIMARPGILLREDLFSIGVPRDRITPSGDANVTCNPNDHACVTLRPQVTPESTGWQIVPPKSKADPTGAIEALRKELRRQTVTDDFLIEGDVPYQATPEELLPLFEVTDPIDLSPVPIKP
jgi:hypothetical protein